MPPDKYPRRRVIAVDVDGTLLSHGCCNLALVAMLRNAKEDGFSLTLWSMGGEAYARSVAEALGLADLFDHIISKPGFVFDDAGWSWVRYTQILPIPAAVSEGAVGSLMVSGCPEATRPDSNPPGVSG